MKFFLICLPTVEALAAPKRFIHHRGFGTIVGGQAAHQGQFSFQLSFQDTSYNPPFHFCGASIYDTLTGITAAHCVAGEDFANPQNLDIVGGDLEQSDDSGFEQRRTVTKIVQHEDYNSRTFENNIALLKIGSAFNFDSNVNAIALAAPGSNYDGTFCIVSGWGTTSSEGPTPDVLKFIFVPVVPDDECSQYYGGIIPSMMCAGVSRKDSCLDDSGGPLICGGEPGAGGVLAGIVSWGRGCALDGYPQVYTEVSYFFDWVTGNA